MGVQQHWAGAVLGHSMETVAPAVVPEVVGSVLLLPEAGVEVKVRAVPVVPVVLVAVERHHPEVLQPAVLV